MTDNARGAVLALIAFALFASHDAIIKVLGGTYSPVQMIFFSVLLSFPLVTIMLMRDTQPGHLRPRHPWWTSIRTGATLVTGISAFYAFSVLPLAQVYAILFASPLLITVLSVPILGETVRLRRWIAVGLGLAGVMIVLRPGTTDLSLGHLAALLCAICGALASIIVRKIGNEERPVVLLIYPMVANFVCMGVALPLVYQPMEIGDLGALALIALLAHVAMRFLIRAYQTAEAAMVAPMQYSQILWASAYGLIFFDETVDNYTLAGAAVIILSGLYIVFRESRPGLSENTPVLNTRSRPDTGLQPRVGLMLERDEGLAKAPDPE